MKLKLSNWGRLATASVGIAMWAGPALADDPDAATVDRLRQMSLDELLNIEVSTASRKDQLVSQTAAAVSVLTQDDLRRMGVTAIPEALRGLPGVEVAQLNSHRWAVSIRGFNEVFANKLLVMVDGRSIYTPLFSGTLWETQDMMIEVIERIEVVRGPGASVWGANAVNGVINIITQSAHDTLGGRLDAGGGTMDEFITSLRYGVSLSETASLRVYGKYRQHAEMEDFSGNPAGDEYQSGSGGFRLDWNPSDTAEFSLSGGGYYAAYNEFVDLLDLSGPAFVRTATTPNNAGGHLLGKWGRQLREGSRLELQTYVDYSGFDVDWLKEERLNFDLELRHRWEVWDRHDLSSGVGFRMTSDQLESTGDTIAYPRNERTDYLYSAFIQDDYRVIPETLTLTAGVRLEHNDYTGFEVQPTLRGLWQLNEKHSLWLAGSRAVRTPSRSESDAIVGLDVYPAGAVHPFLPAVATYSGTEEYGSEELWAFETGYRWNPSPQWHVDATAFYNVYDSLRGSVMGSPFPDNPLTPSYLVLPLTAANNVAGDVWGAEIATVWQAADFWQWRLSYSYLDMQDLEGDGRSDEIGYSPRQQAALLSRLDLPANLELDAQLRFVDELSGPAIPAYLTLDIRLGWRPRENLELSITGYNLTDSPHPEFQSSLIRYAPSAVNRSVFGKITWQF